MFLGLRERKAWPRELSWSSHDTIAVTWPNTKHPWLRAITSKLFPVGIIDVEIYLRLNNGLKFICIVVMGEVVTDDNFRLQVQKMHILLYEYIPTSIY